MFDKIYIDGKNSGKPKPVILTCAQPTGKLTIGNYLGLFGTGRRCWRNKNAILVLLIMPPFSEPATIRKMFLTVRNTFVV